MWTGRPEVGDTQDWMSLLSVPNSFKTLLEAQGGTVKSAYYTQGGYDMVVILEGDEGAVMTSNLKVGSLGNVRTQTLRGFTADEMKGFISNMP